MNKDQLWQAALGEIELGLSRANFITWFKKTFISSMEEEEKRIIIGVPNDFTKRWLEEKYHKQIQTALKNVLGGETGQIIYKVETRNNEGEEEKKSFVLSPATAKEAQTNRFGLNPRYIFETFIVGKGNELAHAACQAVVANPGKVYNPLFIYGGVGLGKTHLIQAVGNELLKQNKKVLYVSCEKFTNDYVQAIRNGKAKEFKDIYRNVDLLLVDDIQFMGGKDGTQEEFFHTFNDLHQTDKQIMVTSDRPPKSIPALEKRLLSRFEWGMIADVGQPDLETRIAILESKSKERNYYIEREILSYIAEKIESNIRELEGVLNRIVAYHEFNNTSPSMDSIRQLIENSSLIYSRPASPKKIIEIVARFYESASQDIVGKSRKKELVKPRQIAMYLLRQDGGVSYPTIGEELGGRDHTTAMHAFNKISRELKENAKLRNEIELIKQLLKNEEQ